MSIHHDRQCWVGDSRVQSVAVVVRSRLAGSRRDHFGGIGRVVKVRCEGGRRPGRFGVVVAASQDLDIRDAAATVELCVLARTDRFGSITIHCDRLSEVQGLKCRCPMAYRSARLEEIRDLHSLAASLTPCDHGLSRLCVYRVSHRFCRYRETSRLMRRVLLGRLVVEP